MSREFAPAKPEDDTIELTPDAIVAPAPVDAGAETVRGLTDEPSAALQTELSGEPLAQVQAEPAGQVQSEPYGQVQPEPYGQVQAEPYAQVQPEPYGQIEPEPADAMQARQNDDVPPVAGNENGEDENPKDENPKDENAGNENTFTEGASEPWSPPAASENVAPENAAQESTAMARNGEPPLPPVPPTPGAVAGADEPEQTDEPDEIPPMSLTEHLGELRTRLVRALLGATLGFFLCYNFSEQLFMWLAKPLAAVMPADTRLIYTSVPEGFFVYLKVAFVAGVFVASPYIFYQIWAFIAPGLYREERRQVLPLALCSAFFFLLGASFCYFMVFPYAFTFFMSYSTGMIVAMPSIDEYLSFSLKMILAFGLIFEMPLFAFFLARMGVVTAAWMRKVRRYAVLVVFVVAAILTPPDVFSQLLMAVPMLVLYEISIYVAAAVGRKEPAEPAKEQA